VRRPVRLRSPQGLLEGFPRFIAGAGAASPRLVDLDNDGSDEVVITTLDGTVHALGAHGDELPGFPAHTGPGALRAAHPSSDAGPAPQAIAGTPAFADLDGDERPDIIVSTLDGEVFAFDYLARPLPGFPVSLADAGTLPCFMPTATGCAASGNSDAGFRDVERGFFASPVVAATAHGPLIIQAGLDGMLHGIRFDGSAAPGFPVLVSDTAQGRSRIVATPAVADMNADGWPEIVVVTIEERGAQAYLFVGALEGPTLARGWPVKLSAADTPGADEAAFSPLIADFDGDGSLEIALQAMNGPLRLYSPSGDLVLELADSTGVGPVTHSAAADLDGDGLLELVATDLGADHQPRLLVWHAGKHLREFGPGAGLPAPLDKRFPLKLTGLESQQGFAIADVNGDSLREVLMGAGDAIIAVENSSAFAAGFPKFTGGAIASSPAVGVVANGLTLAAATREGWVFAWDAVGFPESIAWDGFHHDRANTGYTGTALPARQLASIGVPNPPLRGGCCNGAPGPAEVWAATALLAWLSTRRKKADS
jgi:hypothetical protein